MELKVFWDEIGDELSLSAEQVQLLWQSLSKDYILHKFQGRYFPNAQSMEFLNSHITNHLCSTKLNTCSVDYPFYSFYMSDRTKELQKQVINALKAALGKRIRAA